MIFTFDISSIFFPAPTFSTDLSGEQIWIWVHYIFLAYYFFISTYVGSIIFGKRLSENEEYSLSEKAYDHVKRNKLPTDTTFTIGHFILSVHLFFWGTASMDRSPQANEVSLILIAVYLWMYYILCKFKTMKMAEEFVKHIVPNTFRRAERKSNSDFKETSASHDDWEFEFDPDRFWTKDDQKQYRDAQERYRENANAMDKLFLAHADAGKIKGIKALPHLVAPASPKPAAPAPTPRTARKRLPRPPSRDLAALGMDEVKSARYGGSGLPAPRDYGEQPTAYEEIPAGRYRQEFEDAKKAAVPLWERQRQHWPKKALDTYKKLRAMWVHPNSPPPERTRARRNMTKLDEKYGVYGISNQS